ncbi:G-D-S-L family lipolytic protein [Flavobacterium sp.]|uniref:G-D-S-L family lipolytic protein n=1 Tax=Flavobacterium sp. TaxID=239 RepID=UPI003340F7E1
MIKNIKWLFLVSLTFVACNNDDDVTTKPNSSDGLPLTAGSADFSKYVALGDSFAAGFSDNALFIEGQKTSYPNIMAQQFATVGGGAFTNPFMADNVGGFAGSTTFGPRLYFTGNTNSPLALVTGPSTTSITAKLSGLFNNMGIPGAKVGDLDMPGYGSPLGNPYFTRFASTPMATIVDDAVAQNPTFFSLYIGGNDVLGYATAGGTGSGPTAPATFDNKYAGLINKLTAGGRKGVVGNLPYVNTLPFFTTVPFNAIPLNAAQVSALNSGYSAYNNALTAAVGLGLMTPAEKTARTITFVVGQNAPVIVDEYLTTDLTIINPALIKMRQATSADYLLLSAGGASTQAHLQAGGGTSTPLVDKWVLSAAEANEIKVATDLYNATIEATATAKGLAFADLKSVMNELISPTGISANGFTLKSQFIFGGAFSLDGVHPSPRGYALIANSFTAAINLKYGSNMAPVSFGDYRILFPAVL